MSTATEDVGAIRAGDHAFRVPEVLESAVATLRAAAPLELFAAAASILLPVAISPMLYSYTFTPKFALLLVVAAVGLPQLLVLARRGASAAPARAMLAFLAVALVSAARSRSALVGMFGLYSWGTGWLFWCGAAGAWAVGRSLGDRGRRLVAGGLLAGAAVNATMAIVQEVLRARGPVLGLYQGGQADGLMGNPIYLESLLLGALALALVAALRGRAAWLLLAALLSAALELSGERLAVPLLALLVVAGVAVSRTRRSLELAAVVVGAYGLTYLVTGRLLHTRLQTSVVHNPRTLLWKSLAHAFLHDPLFGYGPGGTLLAGTRYGSLALARRLGVATYFADAHDIVVEVAITTGLLGIAALGFFVVLGVRHAMTPLLGFALLAVAVELVEPLNVGVTPLVLLAFGAAFKGAAQPARVRGRALAAVRGALVAAALLAGASIVFGDFELNEGYLHYDYGTARAAAQVLPEWSQPAALVAQIAANRSVALPDARIWRLRTRHWWQVAVRRDPGYTQSWYDLAVADMSLGRDRLAVRELRVALSLDRYSTDALLGLSTLERRLGSPGLAERYLELAQATAPGTRLSL